MIKRPHDAIREQVKYRQENLKKINLYIEGKINDHLSKYEDEDGVFKFTVPMSDHREFCLCWEDGEDGKPDLKQTLEKSITAAGYKIEKMLAEANEARVPFIRFELRLDMTEEELIELDTLAQKERAELVRVSTLRGNL
jgi:hypothetical protein